MSLLEEIQKLQEAFLQNVPRDVVELFSNTTQELVATGIAARALNEGDKIPDFVLPNAAGSDVGSAELLAQGPIVINFYRGGWCPYCNLELKAYQDSLPGIRSCGAQLVAISPNLPDRSLSSIEKHALEFEVLSDLKNALARQFGLVFTVGESLRPVYAQLGIDIPEFNGDDSYELPIPATYVVDSDGIIKLAFLDADYSKRLEPSTVIQKLREIQG